MNHIEDTTRAIHFATRSGSKNDSPMDELHALLNLRTPTLPTHVRKLCRIADPPHHPAWLVSPCALARRST
jgi:hypothetical protein